MHLPYAADPNQRETYHELRRRALTCCHMYTTASQLDHSRSFFAKRIQFRVPGRAVSWYNVDRSEEETASRQSASGQAMVGTKDRDPDDCILRRARAPSG